ncbi:MAG: transcriptional regulator, TetR family [Firmicutes bacterium]|nr:transcriptional regulator, TetR family [Bacillota bacterium]
MTFKQRAITSTQKEERRQEIIDSAYSLFQNNNYNSLSMAQIAKHAGIAKGTTFLYFKTKEELFLALASQEYNRCFRDINAGLDRYLDLKKACPIEGFIDILQIALIQNQILLRLIAIISVILEQNITYANARQFKFMLSKEIEQTSAILEKAMPFLRRGEGKLLLLQIQVLSIGIQHLSDPAPIVKQVIAEDNHLAMFHVDFTSFFIETVRAILKGFEARRD